MLQSMTGFAVHESKEKLGTISWEIRAVNHRYLEINLRTPEFLRSLEPLIKNKVSTLINRGKIDLTLIFQKENSDNILVINENLVLNLLKLSEQVNQFYKTQPLSTMDILQWPGVLESKTMDKEELQKPILNALLQCLTKLLTERQREGQMLKEFFLKRFIEIKAQLDFIRHKMPFITDLVQKKIWQRYENLKLTCEPTRLEQEIALLLQKMDVAEEMERLVIHIKELERLFAKGGVIGRRVDFLLQELNRETNTLGAKVLEPAITNSVVEIKVLIDQLREQVQNVE